MSYLLFILKTAILDFTRNKGRTFLTTLGILIGVLSVVLLMALGLGLKKYIEDQFESLGSNLVYVMPGSKKMIMRGGGMVGGIKFDDKDVTRIRRIKTIEHVAPVIAKSGVEVSANGKSEPGEIVASNAEIIDIFNLEIDSGRLIQKSDIEKNNKVILLSKTTTEKLFPDCESALGEYVDIANQNYKIIGVVKSKGGGAMGGGGLDDHVYMPYKAAYSFNPDKKYFAIYFKVTDKQDIKLTKEEVQNILSKRYDEDEFSVMEQTEIMESVNSIFSIINLVLVAIAAISLVVGGIGIMNIMYVTVTERIKEIGIRRALGATKNDILFHFLAESILLALIGGILGLGFAFIIVLLLQSIFPAYINIESIILSLGVSSLIGVMFGVFPSKKAADLSPIDAIRYE